MCSNIEYWKELSDYDIDTAEAMLESQRFLYVGFMAHQAIEKILKAYYVKVNSDAAPFSHSLSYLAKMAGLYEYFSVEQKDFIDILEPLNIEARYPTNKEALIKSLNSEQCKSILKKAQELQKCINQKLSKS